MTQLRRLVIQMHGNKLAVTAN